MIEILFWMDVALLLYVYVGYYLVLCLVALFRSRPPVKLADSNYPTLTFLIVAHNEEVHILAKLQQTISLEYPADRLEVIVASDSSTDRTDEIVEAFARRDPRVKLIRVWPHHGKTHAQNVAIPQCSGEIVVFSDATTVYEAMALKYLASNYMDDRVVAVSGRYKYVDARSQASPNSFGSATFWGFENSIKLLQSRISTLTGCSGCIYSVRRSMYVPLPIEACSDLVEPLELVRRRHRVVFEPRALAFEEPTQSSADEFRMRVRVTARGIRAVVSMRSLLNVFAYGWVSFQLISHKVLRWTVPFLLVFLFVLSAFMRAPWAHLLWQLQIAFYAAGLLSLVIPVHRVWKPLGIAGYVWTVMAAIFVSVIELMNGAPYSTWETIRSRDPLEAPKKY